MFRICILHFISPLRAVGDTEQRGPQGHVPLPLVALVRGQQVPIRIGADRPCLGRDCLATGQSHFLDGNMRLVLGLTLLSSWVRVFGYEHAHISTGIYNSRWFLLCDWALQGLNYVDSNIANCRTLFLDYL